MLGDASVDPFLEFRVPNPGIGLEPHERQRRFDPLFVGHGDDGDVVHIGVLDKDLLNITGKDVEAPRHDHVLLAIQDVQKAILVKSAYIAAPEKDPAVLVAPEAEQAQTLHELAMRGDIHGIRRQLDLIERLDDQYTPFVEALRRMAADFDMQRINDFVKPFLKT